MLVLIADTLGSSDIDHRSARRIDRDGASDAERAWHECAGIRGRGREIGSCSVEKPNSTPVIDVNKGVGEPCDNVLYLIHLRGIRARAREEDGII